MWRRLQAWLFRAGNYPDKGVNATRPLLDRLAANLNSPANSPAPMDLEHGPTEAVLDFGRAVPGSAKVVHGAPPGGEVGEWLVSEVDIDPAVDDRLKTRGLSVLLNEQQGTIDKIAITANPRVHGAQFSDETWIPGGELMSKRFDAGEPGATTEPELTEGFLGKLRTALGIGQGGEASQGAGVPPPPDPVADPAGFSDEQLLADPRVKALAASFNTRLATLETKLTAAEQTAATAGSMAMENGIKAFSAELLAKGAMPWMVEALAPIAMGAPTVKVAFTSGAGETATTTFKDLDAQAAARLVLEKSCNPTLFTRLLPVDDNRSVDPDTQAAELAKQIKVQHPEFSITRCQELADQQLAGQVAMTGSK